jgi:hypothetical protein
MFKRLAAVLVAIAFLGVGLTSANAQNRDRVSVVMTKKMDTGSDFGFVSAPQRLDLVLADSSLQEIASNIPERAGGVAREIQAAPRPYLVVCDHRGGHRPFGGPATTVVADG